MVNLTRYGVVPNENAMEEFKARQIAKKQLKMRRGKIAKSYYIGAHKVLSGVYTSGKRKSSKAPRDVFTLESRWDEWI